MTPQNSATAKALCAFMLLAVMILPINPARANRISSEDDKAFHAVSARAIAVEGEIGKLASSVDISTDVRACVLHLGDNLDSFTEKFQSLSVLVRLANVMVDSSDEAAVDRTLAAETSFFLLANFNPAHSDMRIGINNILAMPTFCPPHSPGASAIAQKILRVYNDAVALVRSVHKKATLK